MSLFPTNRESEAEPSTHFPSFDSAPDGSLVVQNDFESWKEDTYDRMFAEKRSTKYDSSSEDEKNFDQFEKQLKAKGRSKKARIASNQSKEEIIPFIHDTTPDRDILFYQYIPNTLVPDYQQISDTVLGIDENLNIERDAKLFNVVNPLLERVDYSKFFAKIKDNPTILKRIDSPLKDFSPLPENDMFEVTRHVETSDQAKIFNQRLIETPKDIDLWLEFVQYTLVETRLTKNNIEKAISVCEKALHANANDTRLTIQLIKLKAEIEPSTQILIYYESYLKRWFNFDLWKEYIEFQLLHMISVDSFLQVLESSLSRFEEENDRSKVILFATDLLWNTGYTEKSIAVCQLLVDIGFGNLTFKSIKDKWSNPENRIGMLEPLLYEESMRTGDLFNDWIREEKSRSELFVQGKSNFFSEDPDSEVSFEVVRKYALKLDLKYLEIITLNMLNFLDVPFLQNSTGICSKSFLNDHPPWNFHQNNILNIDLFFEERKQYLEYYLPSVHVPHFYEFWIPETGWYSSGILKYSMLNVESRYIKFVLSFLEPIIDYSSSLRDQWILINYSLDDISGKSKCKDLLKKFPNDIQLWKIFILMEKGMGNVDEFQRIAHKIQRNTQSPAITRILCEHHLYTGNLHEAKELISSFFNLSQPSNIDVLKIISRQMQSEDPELVCCVVLLEYLASTEFLFDKYLQCSEVVLCFVCNLLYKLGIPKASYFFECCMKMYPHNSFFVSLFYRTKKVDITRETYITKENAINVAVSELLVPQTVHKWRSTLNKAANISPLNDHLWILFLRFERKFGDPKKVLYSALRNCSWSKALYMECLKCDLTYDEKVQIFNLMEEKGIRLRTLLEEINL